MKWSEPRLELVKSVMKDGFGAQVDTANEAPRSLLAVISLSFTRRKISNGFEGMFRFLHFAYKSKPF
jgi:hypothetical protein